MKNTVIPLFMLAALCCTQLVSCTDDDTTQDSITNATVSGETDAIVSLGAEGSETRLTVPIATQWTAKSDASWCQLSRMGGTGGEQVEIVAARNLTGKTRYATITFATDGNAAKAVRRCTHTAFADTSGFVPSDSTGTAPTVPDTPAPSDSADTAPTLPDTDTPTAQPKGNQIRVEQPPYTQPNNDLVLTGAAFDSTLMTVRVDVTNGSSAGTSLSTSTNGVNFQIMTGGNQYAYYPKVPQGQETAVPLYLKLSESGELAVDFYVGNQESGSAVNRLHVRQTPFFKKAQSDLSLATDGSIHFAAGGKLYFGGGSESYWKKTFGAVSGLDADEKRTLSRLMKSYDPATNTLAPLPTLPLTATTYGSGFDLNGIPCIVVRTGFYLLEGGAWTACGGSGGTPVGAAYRNGQAYVADATSVRVYNVTSKKFTLSKTVAHGLSLDTAAVCHTHATDGTLWLYTAGGTGSPVKAWRLNDDATLTQFDLGDESPLGIDGDNLYTWRNDNGRHTVLYRRSISTGKREMLHSSILENIDHYADCVDGYFVLFGKLVKNATNVYVPDTAYPQTAIYTMQPAKYAPMSLTIVNK